MNESIVGKGGGESFVKYTKEMQFMFKLEQTGSFIKMHCSPSGLNGKFCFQYFTVITQK